MGNSVKISRDFSGPNNKILANNITLEPKCHLLRGSVSYKGKHLKV